MQRVTLTVALPPPLLTNTHTPTVVKRTDVWLGITHSAVFVVEKKKPSDELSLKLKETSS